MRTFQAMMLILLLAGTAQAVGRGGGGGRGAGFGMRPAGRPAPSYSRPGFGAPQYGWPGGGQFARPGGQFTRPGTVQLGRPGPQVKPSGAIEPRPTGGSIFRPADGSYIRPGQGPGGSVFYPGGARPGGQVGFGGHGNDAGLASIARQANVNRGGAYYVSGASLNNVGNRVRNNYTNVNVFNSRGWWGRYPNAWRPAAWSAASYWAAASWAAWAGFCGYPATPVYYDYGANVVYQGDNVYIDGQPVATQQQYADQASSIASAGKQATASGTEDWLPLGVFAMVQGDQSDTTKLFQLAVNKDGVIRGNFYDALTETTLPVYGQVDKTTQRAAWTVGDRKDVVYDTGAANLTQDQTTMLVHLGQDQTQQWTLVRIPQPAGGQD